VPALRRRSGQAADRSTTYQAFGLRIRTPLELPCRRAAGRSPADVRITPLRLADLEHVGVSHRASRGWFTYDRMADGTKYLRWRGLFEFLISSDGRRIGYRSLDGASHESLSAYLLGQVLSFALVASGAEPLHGTAVAVGAKAIAFIGDCGYGKSTLGAALLARGCPIVTDDVVAMDERRGRWWVHPGIPRIKLYPAVARHLLADARGTPMNHITPKLIIPLARPMTASRPLELSAIYVLSRPRRRADRVRIDPLAGQEAFLEIVRGAFNLMVVDRQRLANQFAFAERLTGSVPIRRLTYPRNLAVLPDVCEAIEEDVSRLPRRPGSDTRRSFVRRGRSESRRSGTRSPAAPE
jgi:hypothetical protein